jgi:hypothetical protein
MNALASVIRVPTKSASVNPLLGAQFATDDLYIYQGDDWEASCAVTDEDGAPADLTGWSARAQVRRQVADVDTEIAVDIVTTIQPPNTIQLTIPHTDTALLSGTYIWDLELTDQSGIITTILSGSVIVKPEVTR